MESFKVAATGVSLNYMPEYIAQEKGFFTEAGVEVENYAPNPWTLGLDHVNSGEADVVLGGIWVPIMYRNHIKDYVSFAKIASRCPLFIISREPVIQPFVWSDLEDKRVLVTGGDGASHYLMTMGSAREGGADVDKIRFIHDFSTTMIRELFEGGFGDYIVLQPDVANVYIEKGIGHLFCELTTNGSNVPWSVYYGLPERLTEKQAAFNRFALGLQKGTDYLLAHGGEACRQIIAEKWPKMDVEEGIKTIDLFIKNNMWEKSIEITEEELARWQNFLVLGDVLDAPLAYDALIDKGPVIYTQENLNE